MFIELSRRFRELDTTTGRETAALNSYIGRYGLKEATLDWNALLKLPAIVILGEPGSGKTWEFREQALKLRAQGYCALFVRLDGLLNRSLQETLSQEEENLLKRWRRSNERMSLFLDSVDEAKLTKSTDFLHALDVVKREVGDHFWPRLQLIISSRISEWLPGTDAEAVSHQFPSLCSEFEDQANPNKVVRKKTTWKTLRKVLTTTAGLKNEAKSNQQSPRKSLPIKVVQIEPLDKSQIEAFARSKLPGDPELFLTALDDNFAWEFARRPLDVTGLLKFWTEKRRLGSLAELIEYQITESLQESAERQADDNLDPKKAREGAQALAAAATFCRNLTFYVPDAAHAATSSAIDTAQCLASWSPKERGELLLRALFDSPSYGQIRFHHRRTVEYLAAEWLMARLKEGYPVVDLEELLFSKGPYGLILRPSLAPIAAWLALSPEEWGERVRRLILEAEPELFFRSGDPTKLPASYKKELIEYFCKQGQGHQILWTEIDNDALRRLSDPSLADYLSSIIRDSSQAEPVREVILQLARHGRLQGCAGAALEVLADTTATDDLKMYALSALQKIADVNQVEAVGRIVENIQKLRPELGVRFCTVLFPSVITPTALGAILRKIDKGLARSTSWIWYLTQHFEKRLTPQEAQAVLNVLIETLQTPPLIQISPEHVLRSSEFGWVRKLIPICILKLLELKTISTEQSSLVYEAASYLRPWYHEDGSEEDKQAINLASTKHPNLRQHLFWKLIESKEETSDKPFRYHGFDYRMPFTSHFTDWVWCLHDIVTRSHEKHRIIALNYSFALWDERKSRILELVQICRQASRDKACRSMFWRFVAYLPRRLVARVIADSGLHDIRRSYWWKHKWHGIREWYNLRHAQWVLIRGLPRIRNASAIGWLQNLIIEAHRGSNDASLGIRNWEHLEKTFGKWISNATREGCLNFWEDNCPELPHQRKDSTGIPNNLFIGLTGIIQAVERSSPDFPLLKSDAARIAARYAMNELNAFPSWMKTLAAMYPSEVREVLAECIKGEWSYPAEAKNSNEILARLKWQDEGLRPMAAPFIVELLERGAPASLEIEIFCYSILLIEKRRFSEALKKDIFKKLSGVDLRSPRAALLLIVGLQVSADTALDTLENLEPEEIVAPLITAILAALGENHGRNVQLIENPDYLRPVALYRLILLAYKYVATKDDLRHMESFTPTARDDAERFRANLLQRLADNDEETVKLLLDQLVLLPELVAHKDWLLHLIRQRLHRLSENPVWVASEIELFQTEHETEPQRALDLFRIVTNRLRDLKSSLETSDNSMRNQLQPNSKELELRRWVALKLNEKSRNRYTAPQESVIDLEKRPDIRVEHPKAGHVSIEIKWANKWQLDDLINGLEKQLLGTYLKAEKSNHGIFLVGTIDSQQHWKNAKSGKLISFQEVVVLLELHAKSLQDANLGKYLRVISFDFRKPDGAK